MEKRHITRAVGLLALLGAAAALAGCVAPYGPGYYRQGYYGGDQYAHHEDHDHAGYGYRADRYAHHGDADHGDQGYGDDR